MAVSVRALALTSRRRLPVVRERKGFIILLSDPFRLFSHASHCTLTPKRLTDIFKPGVADTLPARCSLWSPPTRCPMPVRDKHPQNPEALSACVSMASRSSPSIR
ncbi:hypothetical protein SCHPADRAFT_193174 [Schizopora paradoxa]|uniref:Uncharacterized protein n=1 Tax=Schizopora paradoxa TaxID=27342 RepID=A0A0H2RZE6_9AGAM|nr:hypothetical protein SCHPADRAFT_193174 [Schizopora paradoxa]